MGFIFVFEKVIENCDGTKLYFRIQVMRIFGCRF